MPSSRGEAVAAWQQILEEKLDVPALPSFAIPTASFDRVQQRVARLLDVRPGLYRGIAVVDARCRRNGPPSAADLRSASPLRSGHYEDATTDITVQANGTGVYESGDLRISVRPDGSGDYFDGTTKVSVRSDGSGVYRDGRVRLNVNADGSGSFDDGSVRLWRNVDGSAGYRDDTSRLSISAAGVVTERGDRVHTEAARRVLAEPFPMFPPVAPARMAAADPSGRSCGSVIRLDATVLFESDQAVVRSEASALLRRVSRLLRALGHPPVLVNGHTDQVGTKAYGLVLSRERAAAVVDVLAENGVPRRRTRAVGYGEAQPLHPEVRPDGSVDYGARRLNRRVEIVLRDSTGQVR
jgi:OOP family OmpA-OmpF porin